MSDHWLEEKQPWEMILTAFSGSEFSKQFYKALTWSHTSPSCVAILSYEQGSCEPKGPSGRKEPKGNLRCLQS